MKKILYISNIQVPYRVKFFNELSKYCDLTVLYERKNSTNRDIKWSKSEEDKYKVIFLNGFKIGNENGFSFKIIKYLLEDYDEIVLGCYNSFSQMFANLFLRIIRKKFFINFDGEIFVDGNNIKSILKRFFIKGAKEYLIAGECAAQSLKKIVKNKRIYTYYFSSILKQELIENACARKKEKKEGILVIGQYFPFKGLDIAVESAKKLPNIKFKFIGTGNRTDLFIKENNIKDSNNIEVIPFLKKEDLKEEYRKCRLFVLPSRQECWGLVINEAASFGTPIISTYGSGVAIEFLSEKYKKYLVNPESVEELIEAIKEVWTIDKNKEYSEYLIEKSKKYNIEDSVKYHLKAFEII